MWVIESKTGRLQRNAVQAIHDAVRNQSAEIERQTIRAMATPLQNIGQAAAQVRQNVKETSWWMVALLVSAGTILGLALGWLPFRNSLNNLQEQGNRIEQYLAAQQQANPTAPASPQASVRKGKK